MINRVLYELKKICQTVFCFCVFLNLFEVGRTKLLESNVTFSCSKQGLVSYESKSGDTDVVSVYVGLLNLFTKK